MSGRSSFIPFLKYLTPCPMLFISSGIFFAPNKSRTMAAITNSSELPIIKGKTLISNIIEIIKVVEIIDVITIIVVVIVVVVTVIAAIT